MFGWEFPPFNSGGLGVACEGLVKALINQGVKIIFVLPKKIDRKGQNFKIVFADSGLAIKTVDALLSPYITPGSYQLLLDKMGNKDLYGSDLLSEVFRYGQKAKQIALTEKFDVIHAHDWLSFPAGIEAKKTSGKPLVVHIHATEFDRTGGHNLNPFVYQIEKRGMELADAILAVSNFTKNKIVEYYSIEPEKIRVVYNAIEQPHNPWQDNPAKALENLKKGGKKIVVFVGRITLQKGPDYFLKAAKKALAIEPNIVFMVVGSGDMEHQIIEQTAELGIADKVLFAGFLRGEELKNVYQIADLYVLSSVSEPFGMTVLEALHHNIPVIVSKQSGIAEALLNALKVDFWDTDEMANKMLAVLRYKELEETLKEGGKEELKKFSWQDSAQKCIQIYNELLVN